MRVRLDSNGRPRSDAAGKAPKEDKRREALPQVGGSQPVPVPSAPSAPSAPSESKQVPSILSTNLQHVHLQKAPSLAPKSSTAKRASSPKPSSSKPVVVAKSSSPSKPAPSSSAAKTVPLKALTSRSVVDDERSSDTSSHTEAYNSEDEHTVLKADEHLPTLRQREEEFVQVLAEGGLRIIEMRADGNCLFRALAHALWGDAELHMTLRAKVIEMLVQERDYFSQFVAEDFMRYVRRKRREGVHGNHLELQAAAELFGRPIEVYSYAATPTTVVEPWGGRVEGVEPVRLSFHRGSHYNALERGNGKGEVDEVERAVMALSLVEASRGAGGSSVAPVPSAVLALVHAGWSEDRAWEAYRVAGEGGVVGMVRFLREE